LLGASNYFDVFEKIAGSSGLPIIPAMQTLVDFKGYRIVALPLLPINKNTIVYGSADTGRTVHNSKKVVSDYMQKAAEEMHLAGHKVQSCILFSAGDVEVHFSFSDDASGQRFYLLDLARCFPPESLEVVAWMSEYRAERADALETNDLRKQEKLDQEVEKYCSSNGSRIFHRMLRPEALLLWKQCREGANRPLSSDVFSKWGSYDESSESLDSAVYDATTFMFETQMLKLAEDLLQTFGHLSFEQLWDANFAEAFHNRGVNIRHIGCVAEECRTLIFERLFSKSCESVVQRLSAEILFRALKNAMRDVLRKAANNTDSSLKIEVTKFINDTLSQVNHGIHGLSRHGDNRDSLMQRISQNYGTAAIRILLIYSDSWRPNIGKIFLKIFHRCGIEIDQEIRTALILGVSNVDTVEDLFMHSSEILSFSSKVKKMAFFDFVQAQDIAVFAKQSEVKSLVDRGIRLRKVAIRVLKQSLCKFPSNPKLRGLLVEQTSTLLISPQFWSCQINGFEEPAQKRVFLSHSEFVDFAIQMRRLGNFQGAQMVMCLLELLLFPREQFRLIPSFLDPDVKGPFEVPGFAQTKSRNHEALQGSEDYCDVSIVEYLMFVQLVRMEMKRRGKSVKELNWVQKEKFFEEYGEKQFNKHSPEFLIGLAILRNSYVGYGGLEPTFQIEMIEMLKKACNLSYCPSLKYFQNFCKLSPSMAFLSMLFPSDFGDILMKTHTLKLYVSDNVELI
jgi:hypothetical protein